MVPQISLSPILKIEKNALRAVSGLSYYSHTSHMFKEYIILKFVDLLQFKLGTFMYKAKKGLTTETTESIFDKCS